jgi:8-oxo-dGTP diphosphatase
MKPAGPRRKTVHVAVGVLVRDDGAVLLADRPVGKAYAGYWEFPGGKIEAGETVEAALARELHEELGIDIARSVPWVAFEFDYPHAYVRLHFRRVVRWSGAPHAREGQRLGFFLPSEAPPEPLLPAAVPAMRWLTLPPIYAISNIAAGGVEPFMRALGASLQRGLRLLAVREPAMNVAQLAALAPRIIAQAHASRARVLVSSRHDRSLWSLFDGVHLTSEDLLRAERRPVARLVAASVHDRNQLAHAHRLCCDFAVLGPLRATASHPAAATLDWSGFMQIAEEAAIPVYAIGGLTPADLPDAQRAGAHGVALLRAAWTAR